MSSVDLPPALPLPCTATAGVPTPPPLPLPPAAPGAAAAAPGAGAGVRLTAWMLDSKSCSAQLANGSLATGAARAARGSVTGAAAAAGANFGAATANAAGAVISAAALEAAEGAVSFGELLMVGMESTEAAEAAAGGAVSKSLQSSMRLGADAACLWDICGAGEAARSDRSRSNGSWVEPLAAAAADGAAAGAVTRGPGGLGGASKFRRSIAGLAARAAEAPFAAATAAADGGVADRTEVGAAAAGIVAEAAAVSSGAPVRT